MKQMSKKEYLDSVVEEVRMEPILEIVENYIRIEKVVSDSHLAYCPFHSDNSIGSFSISKKKNMFRCFSCNKTGDSIKLISHLTGINYGRVAMDIAKERNLIAQKEYDDFFGKNKARIRTKKVFKKVVKEEKEDKRHDDNILDVVYNCFLDHADLRDYHKKYLMEVRKLSKKIIEERKYKTNVARLSSFMKDFIEELKEKEELKDMTVDEILSKTPGFYQVRGKNGWNWTYYNVPGVIIPIQNFKGQIVGLQVRRDTESSNAQRYAWFSSSFANNGENKNQRNGTNSGVLLDILYPKNIPSRGLFITEGRFKSEKTVEYLSATTISVQGIRNYKEINETIKEVERETKKRFKDFKAYENICIVFDSEEDEENRKNIYEAMKNMSDKIEKEIKDKDVFYISWDTKYKGIDDLLLSKEARQVKNYYELMKIYKKGDYDKENKGGLKEKSKK